MWSFAFVLWYMYTGTPACRYETDNPVCDNCLKAEVHWNHSPFSSFFLLSLFRQGKTKFAVLKRYFICMNDYTKRFWAQPQKTLHTKHIVSEFPINLNWSIRTTWGAVNFFFLKRLMVRALHWFLRGHVFKSRSRQKFFRLSFHSGLICLHF